MPFKSKRQMKKFFAMEKRGEIPKGKAREWTETSNIKDLQKKSKGKIEERAYELAMKRRKK